MRQANEFQKSDERILRDGDFVERVLSRSQEQLERKYMLRAQYYDLYTIATKVGDIMSVKVSKIWAPGRDHSQFVDRHLRQK